MRKTKRRDPCDFLAPSRLEKYVLLGQSEPVEKTLRAHPFARRVTQIETIRIEMPKLGLVADDDDRNAALAATLQEIADPIEHQRIRDPPAINNTLQPLPFGFTVWQQPDRIADILFVPDEAIDKQAFAFCC
ncbi:MAG TPA: hypothetical protein VNQ56_18920 [Pseudolabrys sp.]|nr:hypothetical protein [Pseudolabrys sp.]